jgi:hypothetical protein
VNPDDPAVALRTKQHDELRIEVEKRLLQNADNFDKAILTYSAAGLALSLGFLKDFVPIESAAHGYLLFSSWALFVVAVVVTVLSYLTSQLAQHRLLEKSYLYNIELDDDAFDLPNVPQQVTAIAAYVAGGAFVLAVAASTLFVAANLSNGASMTKRSGVPVNNGATVPTMQKIPQVEQRGAPTPTMQRVPPSPPAQAPSAPAPTSGGSAPPTKG